MLDKEIIKSEINNKKKWYKQDLLEEDIEKLIGKEVYAHGTVPEFDEQNNEIGRKEYAFEAHILGYTKEVMKSDEDSYIKYGLLTDEGYLNSIVSDMIIEIQD